MFSFLFGSVKSLYLAIQTEEQLKNLASQKKLPVFFYLHDNDAQTEQIVLPHWIHVANQTEFHENIFFADVNCENYSEICQNYFPYQQLSFYWMDPANATMISYGGAVDYRLLTHFVRKQLNAPFIYIDEIDVKNYNTFQNGTSNFLFRVSSRNTSALATITQVTERLRSQQSYFLVEYNSSHAKPSLECFLGHKMYVPFSQEFNARNIESFILRYGRGVLAPLSKDFVNYYRMFEMPVLVIVLPQNETYPEILSVVSNLAAMVPISYVNPEENEEFCSYVQATGLTYVMYNTTNFLYHKLEGNQTIEQLGEWIQKVLANPEDGAQGGPNSQPVSNKNDHRVSNSKPRGLFFEYLNQKIAELGEKQIAMIAIPSFAIIAIVIIIWAVHTNIKMDKLMKAKSKKSQKPAQKPAPTEKKDEKKEKNVKEEEEKPVEEDKKPQQRKGKGKGKGKRGGKN